MDQDFNEEVLDVRKAIEKTTSKVSLRDLEKKGFRQVKVLRAGDINQLIFKEIQKVLAKHGRGVGMSDEQLRKIGEEAQAEVKRQIAEKQALMKEKGRLEEEKARVDEGFRRLEDKVNQLNAQISAEKQAFQSEKAAFEQEKRSLYDKGLEGQQSVARQFEGQISDLKARLAKAEEAAGGIPQEEYDAVRDRAKRREQELEGEIDSLRAKIKGVQEEGDAYTVRLKRQVSELEENEERLRRRAEGFEEENKSLREDVTRLRKELEEAPAVSASGTGMNVDAAEMQRMRFEMEQRDAKMKDLISGLASTLVTAGSGGGGGDDNPDLTKQFKSLQLSLSDQLRKGLAGVGGGKAFLDADLSPEAAALLFQQHADVEMETNITNISMKETKAAGVKDKLSRLRNLRKK
jgi:predicted  nucleic acid-binding Zn-ribbon protein